MRELVQQGINHIYDDFIGKTATTRQLDVKTVDGIAQGRVWTGQQALDRKLIDRVGSLKDAFAAAREIAKVDAALPVRYRTAKPSSPLAAILEALNARVSTWLGGAVDEAVDRNATLAALKIADPVASDVAGDLVWLREMISARKPYGAVVHCLCQPGL